jgi:hypothetical protein
MDFVSNQMAMGKAIERRSWHVHRIQRRFRLTSHSAVKQTVEISALRAFLPGVDFDTHLRLNLLLHQNAGQAHLAACRNLSTLSAQPTP